jgi:hypothetical protein
VEDFTQSELQGVDLMCLYVTVWNLSYFNMGWCLTLGEMILPILH